MRRIPVRIEGEPLTRDEARVLAKPFVPTGTALLEDRTRAELILDRVLRIPEEEVSRLLAEVRDAFRGRHPKLEPILERHFSIVASHLPDPDALSPERRLLVGAYFTKEYALEGAALTNPSIAPAPDQSGLGPGEVRFVMSLRSIGEGHISSIQFRQGVVDRNGNVSFDRRSPFTVAPERRPANYSRPDFMAKLSDLGFENGVSRQILEALPEPFSLQDLEKEIIRAEESELASAETHDTVKRLHWVASSNYVSAFPADSDISERVLFPAGPPESLGMEDARFVRFTGADGSATWYATYTAFDGTYILPQLIETPDFLRFRIATLSGPGAVNKGMALFPRLIAGRYWALGRHDRESIHVMSSDHPRRWSESWKIRTPEHPWELVQIGNCGSPMETEEGWLVLTHGVGPMRRYTMGALLLDLDDPGRVRGALREPFLEPPESRRDGYVPNVVYSCGGMVHGDHLILPHGYADVGTAIAVVPLAGLLEALLESPDGSG